MSQEHGQAPSAGNPFGAPPAGVRWHASNLGVASMMQLLKEEVREFIILCEHAFIQVCEHCRPTQTLILLQRQLPPLRHRKVTKTIPNQVIEGSIKLCS